MNKNMFPPSITNLLLQEGQRFEVNGKFRTALGTGVIPVIGVSRSGKTSGAYSMLDYVIKFTNRPVILDSFPKKVIDEGIPEHWKGRVTNTKFADIATINEPAVWLVDDTGVGFNSRDWNSNGRILARTAGILSHFGGGMTVIFTTQSLSGVDVSFFRYTNLAPVIRYVDDDVLRFERPEWRDIVEEGQYELQKVSNPRHLDWLYSSKDKMLVKVYFPDWLDKKNNPIVADLMSRPMRYHTLQDKLLMVSGKGGKTSKERKDKENMTE